MIRRVSGLPDRLIEGIQVFDAFSLVTIPFDAAERIIRESRGSGGIPRMRVAKEDGGGEGGYRARPPRRPALARGHGPGAFENRRDGRPCGGPTAMRKVIRRK
jgi:hypothetical protein